MGRSHSAGRGFLNLTQRIPLGEFELDTVGLSDLALRSRRTRLRGTSLDRRRRRAGGRGLGLYHGA